MRFSKILLLVSISGFVMSAAIHGAAVAGVSADAYPVSPFLLHLLSLVCFGAAVIHNSMHMREIPPRERTNAFLFVLKQRPRWFLALILLLVAYSSANLLLFASASTLRAFSSGWMLFFAGAAFFAYPVLPVSLDEPAAGPPPVSFHVPASSLFSRMMEGPGKFVYGWLALLSLGFAVLGFFEPGFLFLSGFFLLGLSVNLFLRMRAVRVHISSAVVAGGVFSGEVYRYNTSERFHFPLSDLKVEWLEHSIRGNSIFLVKVSDLKGKELLTQYFSKAWHYDLLRQLYERLAADAAESSVAASSR